MALTLLVCSGLGGFSPQLPRVGWNICQESVMNFSNLFMSEVLDIANVPRSELR